MRLNNLQKSEFYHKTIADNEKLRENNIITKKKQKTDSSKAKKREGKTNKEKERTK